MSYSHTHYAPLGYILLVVAAVEIALGILFREHTPVMAVLVAVGTFVLVVAAAFGRLTISDEGEFLALRYGPLPLFRKRIPYAEITGVEPDRSLLIDGWGIHYLPWRGWTYNLWGLDCVRLQLGRRVIRVGSDDVDNLVEFLRHRIVESPSLAR